MDHTQSLPSAVGGPSTITNAGVLASSTRPPSAPPARAPHDPLPRAFGRYDLVRLLGRGGMGSVYLAHDSQLDRDVALKIPRPFGENPTLWRERFFTEARAAATLSHPNICPVFDVGEHEGQPFLTMAYIDGETLSAKLRAAERLPVHEAVGVVAAVARAMAEAHARGIVHRDLKPGNVMIDHRGRPVVTDFGLALRTTNADDLRVTLTGVALGTPAYMPPEQAGGDVDAIGPPADVYALGVILFELVTGRTPFKAKSFGKLLAQIERDPPPLPSSLAPDVPPALDAVILTALSKSPGDRFPTAAEFADALEQFQAGRFDDLTSRYGGAITRTEESVQQTRPYPAPPRKRTNWWPAVAAGFLGLLVLLAGAIYVTTDKGELKVEFLDPDTGKPISAPPGIDVKVNGQRVVLDPDGKPISVRAGEDQMLVVTGEDFVTESQTFTLKRWKDATVRVTLVPKERLAKRPDPVVPLEPIKPGTTPTGKTEEKPPPPKPVEFPKGKTLIEVPGWQMLCDATREEMDAWLDEKKKAKQSVMWLDAYPVAGKPLYTAVAALDDRQPKWGAILADPIHNFGENTDEFKALARTHHPVAAASYPAEKQTRIALLFHPGTAAWTVFGAKFRDNLDELEKDVSQHGFGYTTFRPHPGFRDTTTFATVIEPTAEGGKREFDLSAEEVEKFAAEQRKAGTRVGSVCGYTTGGILKFAAVSVANPNKTEWEVSTGLPADKLAEVAKEKAKSGFHPTSVTAYAWDGAVRYCVVWVKEPPRPTPYPKDKVVMKQGEWETLLNATKEQMQSWLDEKKKAKQSVVWLDAVEVDGKPLFSAVAALDDRAANWKAFLDTPAEDYANGNILKLVGTTTDHPLAVSGYGVGGKPRSVSLWRGEQWPFYILPDAGPDGVKTAEVTLKGGNGVLRFIRPYTVGKGTVFGVAGHNALGEKASYLLDATEEELAAFVKARQADGERVTSLAMHVKDGKPVYTVVGGSFPDKVSWRTGTGLTAEQYATAAAAQAKDGFRPASVTACPWDGAVRYCAIWVKEPPRPVKFPEDKLRVKFDGYEMVLDASKEQMESWLADRKKAKHSVLWLDAYPVDGQPVFSAVAALDDRQPNWTAILDMSADEARNLRALRKVIDTENNTVVSMGGFARDGDPRISFLWREEAKSWGLPIGESLDTSVMHFRDGLKAGAVARVIRPFHIGDKVLVNGFLESSLENTPYRHALSASELDTFLADRRKDGTLPVAVSGYVAGGQPQFAVVCRPNKDKVEWELGLAKSASELDVIAKERAKTRFRPASVTAYAWDGAVRYCVVWVKDPPKPVKPPKEKTLIEVPGWQLLCDATKDQMQAWLDERKKAKQSVVFLDVCEVAGNPVFSAVAALDDRAPEWKTYLDTPADTFGKPDVFTQFDPKVEHVAALSGYRDGKKILTASLWPERRLPWYLIPDTDVAGVKLAEDTARDANSVIRGIRPYPVGDNTAIGVFAHKLIGEKATYLIDVSESEADEFVKKRREGSERVASYAIYPKDGKLLHAVLSASNPDNLDWRIDRGLTAEKLKATAAERRKDGFIPQNLTACPHDGAVRYCVVWVKEPEKKEKPVDKK